VCSSDLTISGSITLENGAVIKDNASDSVSFGYQAGLTNQGTQSVAIGNGAGYSEQSHGSVAVGVNAGAINQGQRAVALGSLAGTSNQGEAAIAIGNFAAPNNQGANSIVISATGTGLENTIPNSLVIAPIRNVNGNHGVLQYNTASNEVSYATTLNGITNLATTGSNQFSGSQEITGSVKITGSVTIDNIDSAWIFREDGVLKLNDGIAEIYADANEYSLRIGTAAENVAPNTQIILGGSQSFKIKSGPPLRQWDFDSINGDFNLTGSINGALNLPTTGSNTFIGNQIVSGTLNIATNSGDEGGEIQLGKAVTNTTIAGNSVVMDVFRDRVRIFEDGGSNRGAFLNVVSQSAGVSSEIVTSPNIFSIQTISSASYAALTPPVSGTLYIII
jgi:hypothetical protein